MLFGVDMFSVMISFSITNERFYFLAPQSVINNSFTFLWKWFSCKISELNQLGCVSFLTRLRFRGACLSNPEKKDRKWTRPRS